jgi:hypothetical protein
MIDLCLAVQNQFLDRGYLLYDLQLLGLPRRQDLAHGVRCMSSKAVRFLVDAPGRGYLFARCETGLLP